MSMDQLRVNDVALIGINSDVHSSYRRGPASAPEIIRKALHCGIDCVYITADIYGAFEIQNNGCRFQVFHFVALNTKPLNLFTQMLIKRANTNLNQAFSKTFLHDACKWTGVRVPVVFEVII